MVKNTEPSPKPIPRVHLSGGEHVTIVLSSGRSVLTLDEARSLMHGLIEAVVEEGE